MQVLIPQKIAPPQLRSQLTPRPQLCQQVLGNLDRKVSLVSAPAGYGKSSLALELSCRSKVLSCWYRLDAKDSNLTAFYAYLCESLSQRLPEFKAQLPQPSPDETPWGLAGLITSTLYKHVSEPLLLVLDNFHEIDAHEPINRFVDALITYLPPTCHLLILSRTGTDLNLAKLIAQQNLNLITRQDLSLSLEEASGIASQFAINDMETVRNLHQKVAGWGAGFTLLVSQQNHQTLSLSPEQLVRDYLKTEFFDGLELLEQRFALYSAALAPFALQNLETEFAEDTQGLIERFTSHYQMLYEAGRDAQSRVLYAYTPLVQSFLSDYLEHHDPELWRELNTRTGEQRWNEGHFEGLEYLTKAKRYDLIVENLAGIKSQLLETGEWRKLGPWLQSIPEADLAQQGELLSILAETEVMGQPAEALRHYRSALKRELAARTRAVALVGELRALFKLQRFEDVVKQSESTLAELRATPSTPSKKELARAYSLTASSQLMLGCYADAKRNFDEVARLAKETQDDYLDSLATRGLAAHAGHAGDVHRATRLDQQTLAYWQARGNSFEVATLYNNLATNYYDLGDLETALQHGLRAFKMRDELELIGRFALLCCTLGDIYRAARAPTQAKQHYDLALRHSQSKPFAQGYALQGLSALSLDRKELEAEAQAAQALKLARENGLRLLEGLAHLRLGQAKQGQIKQKQAEQKPHSAATQHFDEAITLFAAMGAQRELGLAHFFKSRVITGESADEHRRQAERIESKLGYALLNQTTSKLSLKPEPYQKQLRLRTLGQLEFQLDGAIIPIKAWNGRKPRDIVLYLASQPQGASRDQIIDALWGEGGAKLEQQFSIVLSRARRALGQEPVIIRRDQLYSFAEDIELEEDAGLIETMSVDAPDEAIEAALAAYQGDYLPGYYDNWVETRREQLRTKALLLLGFALKGLAVQNLHKVPDLAAKALAIDPCHEASHQQLIRYYLKHQGLTPARRQYQQYLEALEEMGLTPDPAITALLDT